MTCPLAMAGKFQYASTLSIYQVYDDNIFFASESLGQKREDDFITIVSPSSVLSYESPRATISASYMSGLEFFYANPDENTTQNQNASISLNLQPTRRITLEASDRLAFYAAEHNRGFLSGGGGLGYLGYYGGYRREQALEATPEERTRGFTDMLAYPTDYWGNFVDTNISCQISKSTTARGGYSNGFFHYNEVEEYEGVALEDSRTSRYYTGVDYQRSVSDTFNLGYDYRQFSYTEEVDTNIHSITAGWVHNFSPSLSLNFSGGVMFIPGLYGAGDTDEQSVHWRMAARLAKSFRHTTIGFGYTRDASAYGGLGGTGIHQVWSLDIGGRLTRHLDATLTGSYSTYQPTTREEERVSAYYQDLEYYTAGLTLGYDFTRRLRGTSSYFYTHQNIEIIGRSGYHQAMGGFEYILTPWLGTNLLYTYSNFTLPWGMRDINIYDNRIILGLSFTWARPM